MHHRRVVPIKVNNLSNNRIHQYTQPVTPHKSKNKTFNKKTEKEIENEDRVREQGINKNNTINSSKKYLTGDCVVPQTQHTITEYETQNSSNKQNINRNPTDRMLKSQDFCLFLPSLHDIATVINQYLNFLLVF